MNRLMFAVSLSIILVLFLHASGITRSFEDATRERVRWIYRSGYAGAVTLRSLGDAFMKDSALVSTLQERINVLTAQNASISLLEEENETLRKMLGFAKFHATTLIHASVIGVNPNPTESALLLDRGKNDGVRLSAGVSTEGGMLIGRIQSVDAHTSIVRLLTDRRSRIEASIVNEQKSRGIVEGRFQIGLSMRLIPIAEKIEPGQAIITTGRTSLIPQGLVIGYIGEIQSKASDPFQTAIITPAIDYSRIQLVSIVGD